MASSSSSSSSSTALHPIVGTSRDPQSSGRPANLLLRSPPPTLPINVGYGGQSSTNDLEMVKDYDDDDDDDEEMPYVMPELFGELEAPMDELSFQDKLMDRLKSKMSVIDLTRVCRICLVQYDVIYDVFDLDDFVVRDVYRYYRVKMAPDDGKSNLLCHGCYIKIMARREEMKKSYAYQFIYNFMWRKDREAKSTSNNPRNIIKKSTTLPFMIKPPPRLTKLSRRGSFQNGKKKTRSYKRRKFGDTICTFCNSHTIAEQGELKSSTELNLCAKHSMPHTCLVPNCKLIFPNKELFIAHYRYHLNLDRNTYLCHVCFGVLDCPRKVKKEEHVHQPVEKLFTCCLNTYKSMGALAGHKYQNHCTKIIMSQSQCRSTYLDQTSINSQLLFTCLVAKCDKVFNSCTHNLNHYTQHANISIDCHVCNVCLNNYGEDRSMKMQCNHHNQSILCNHCKITFSSLHDLAIHKLCVHDSVALCGSNDIPGCPNCSLIFEPNFVSRREHYKSCYDIEICVDEPVGNVDTPQTSSQVSQINNNEYNSSENNEDNRGIYMCSRCNSYCQSVSIYINHMFLSHKCILLLKEPGIRMCPLCDENYPIIHFAEHLDLCTDAMRIHGSGSNEETQSYGCAYCKSVISNVLPHQFRLHYMYCKTFNSILEGTQTYYKCANCTFKHIDYLKCIEHANSHCIHFQLKMKYAMAPNEKLCVNQRIQLTRKNSRADSLPLLNFKPLVFNDEISSRLSNLKMINCNSTNYKLIDMFNYYCCLCHKYFFNLFIFTHHMNNNGEQCRSRPLWYCKFCLNDFFSEDQYHEHLSDSKIDAIISCLFSGVKTKPPPPPPTLRRQLVQEENDESVSEVNCCDDDQNFVAYKLFDFEEITVYSGFEIAECEQMKNKLDNIRLVLNMKVGATEEDP